MTWPRRFARFVRSFFSSGPPHGEQGEATGGIGVREPRRPRRPTLGGAVALEAPPEKTGGVEALGEERD